MPLLRCTALLNWRAEIVGAVSAWTRHFAELPFDTLLAIACKATAQIMSNHGLLGEYRFRLGIALDDVCSLCGEGPDNAEHALFSCPALLRIRSETLDRAGIRRPSDLAGLRRPDAAEKFVRYCKAHHELKRRFIFAD